MNLSQEKNMMLGSEIIHLNSVDSTNNYTAKLAKDGNICHGTVIMADEQTNGRGQRGTSWQSEAGKNLQFSIYVEHSCLLIGDQQALTHLISVALRNVLFKLGLVAKIKWPNDLLIVDEKIAGILIENQIKGDKITSSVVGVGFNVNQSYFEGFKATSLFLQTGSKLSLNEVLMSFVNELQKLWNVLEMQSYAELKALYYKHLFGYRQMMKFEDVEGVFIGIIEAVTEDGLLQMYRNGVHKNYDLKQIKYLL
jgi:BirA family biotin operon repressor/biotin-[acetyl-CoA-carboxylase] ligase